jgi:hypothetical protein
VLFEHAGVAEGKARPGIGFSSLIWIEVRREAATLATR